MKMSVPINGIRPAREVAKSVVQVRPASTALTANAESFLNGDPGINVSKFEFAPVEVFAIKNCVMLPTGAVVTEAGFVIEETLEGSLIDNGIPQRGQWDVEIGSQLDEPIYATSKFGTFNYSVFLHEVLPAIYVAASRMDLATGFAIGYPSFFMPERRSKFKEFYAPFCDPSLVVDISNVITRCSEALVVSPGARLHNLQRIKKVMPGLAAEFALSLDPRGDSAPERLYVLREEGSIREPANREQIMEWAASHDFTCVELANLSFSEQAFYFQNAKVIFAEHGAGLANLWHCKKGTKIFELFPDKLWGRWLYRAISALCGLDYAAAKFPTSEGWIWNRDPVRVPANLLNDGLRHFGLE